MLPAQPASSQQWQAVGRFGEWAGRLPPPQRTESTPAAALATAARGGDESPDRSAPLPVAENPMLQLLIEHSAQIENMQKMMQNMMKNMVSQRTPPALLLPSCPPAPLPAPAASFPRLPPPPLPAGRSVAQTSCDPWAPPDPPAEHDLCREMHPESSVSASSGGAVNPGLRAAARLPLPGAPHQGRPANQQQLFPGDMCRECEIQQAHICLCSEKSSVSAGGLRRAEVAGPPAAALPSESGAGRQHQLFTDSAAIGPLPGRTGSVISSVASRQNFSIQSALIKLQRAIMKMRENLEKKGQKQISYQQESMSEYASKLC